MAITLRPSEALGLWHHVLTGLVLDGESDLTLRQLTILMTIYLEPPPHTVRGLAARLGVTKPVITRALDTMGHRKLVTRRRDPQDRRNVIIQRTVDGALFLERLGDRVVAEGRRLTL
ncbi:MAG: MarR family transcriptional regulator [Rhodobiaceae bacterium]|nr:MarR family transcriptional regulator [Rhodobiaceae bacterium]